MKTLLVLVVAFFLSSCLLDTSKTDEPVNEVALEKQHEPKQTKLNRRKGTASKKAENPSDPKSIQQDIRLFEIRDPKTGMVSATIPFPSDWQQIYNDREWTFKGSNDIKVSGEFGKHFMYGTPYGQYSGNTRNPMELQQIIDEFFMPVAQQTNRSLLTTYEVPKVAQTTHGFRTRLWQYAPSQQSTKAYAMEWQDTKGMKYITVLNVFNDQSQLGSNWGFYGKFLQAPSQDFQRAKKAFLYGLENMEYNPKYIAVHNQNEINRANIRNTAHQQRMAAIKARGNASQSIAKTYSEISDISHAGFLKRSNINSNGHSKTINTIGERTVIGNHNTGEHYNVQAGSKYYWVNNNGEYFGTDNSLFDPRIDNKINGTEWVKFEKEN
ncbi:hypothetical protein [Marixanthomonas spongiae]|nr:hypothetical protein [Marixanthomonas spongiae]